MATSHACQLTLPTREGVEPSCGWSDRVLLCRSVEHVEEEHVVREHVVDERVVLDESLVLMRPVLIVVLSCNAMLYRYPTSTVVCGGWRTRVSTTYVSHSETPPSSRLNVVVLVVGPAASRSL